MVSPLSSITGDFVKACTIQEFTSTQDESGEPTQVWVDLSGHVALKCSISRGDGRVKGEQVRGSMTITFDPLKVTLFDFYPDITTKHRAIIGGTTYDILDVYRDSLGYSTILQVVSVC